MWSKLKTSESAWPKKYVHGWMDRYKEMDVYGWTDRQLLQLFDQRAFNKA